MTGASTSATAAGARASRRSARVLLLDARTDAVSPYGDDVLERVDVADVHELAEIELDRYPALFVPGFVDQEFLWRRRRAIASFLDAGRVVVFCGHLLRPWLPGCGAFVAAPVRSFRDYEVRFEAPHPVFHGVDARDLSFRRGVAGFFARGHHPPPPGAVVLARLAGGAPATWLDRTVTRGTVFAHAGNNLLAFDGDGTAVRLAPQLLEWAATAGSGG